MYFGALSVGADITGGFLALPAIKKSNRNTNSISISFKKPGNYYLDNIAF